MSAAKRAPGPYSYDDDDDYVPTKAVKYSEREDLNTKEKKHSLDSDEEEEDAEEDGGDVGRNYDVLKDEDIDGQEERTVDFEGETTITPFNMKEEMEAGHFDGDGFYHFKKDAEVKDAWLEDIDWIKVKHREGDEKKYGSDLESDGEASGDDGGGGSTTPGDATIKIYQDMFTFLKEGESVAKALKRLGGNKKMSSAQKWKLKKSGNLGTGDGDKMADFNKLTELANNIILTGNMDVYQETYEMINLKVKRSKASTSSAPSMDMFSEEGEGKKEEGAADSVKEDDGGGKDAVDKVSWELRWEDKDDAEVHGPFATDKMLEWQESGYFKKGAYVRKTNEQGESWYTTRRIDFDLYT